MSEDFNDWGTPHLITEKIVKEIYDIHPWGYF